MSNSDNCLNFIKVLLSLSKSNNDVINFDKLMKPDIRIYIYLLLYITTVYTRILKIKLHNLFFAYNTQYLTHKVPPHFAAITPQCH